ncbi:protein mesh isoform X2 [Nematostella vectensis]|uniref:protein mesh isoform X2 n=1 Tax=Nematostella vectensis TaxID=45351 RepID=UPI002077818E|nr:protein mesh isoform X2 [Nematostella vectensis]
MLAFRLCLVLGLFALAHTIPLSDFYSFGASTADFKLPANDDGSSGEVRISTPFAFFDKNFDSLFVNTNGAVSFTTDISQYTPDPFPLGANRRLLSPFWADVDTRNGGEVWYREETANQALLNRASDDVKIAFPGQKRFIAHWLYIVTWDHVAFYGSTGVNRNKTNTFQAILTTNGRHSFAIFHYNEIEWTTGTASGGNASGLGGKPAQCGFNAGDNVRFFAIPGSRTAQVLNLANTTNVGRPGVWIFRVDSAEVEAGGCNTAGSIVPTPPSAPMLGGTNIILAGPCYEMTDNIICEFANKYRTRGVYVNEMRAICTAPLVNMTGRVPLKLSTDDGKTFPYKGVFSFVSMARTAAQITRESPETWIEGSELGVTWDPDHLAGNSAQGPTEGSDQDVEINLVSTMETRFATLVQVKKSHGSQSSSTHQWIWSDLFTWSSDINRASTRCGLWYNREPGTETLTESLSFLHCPGNLLQAMADRGRYMEDEHCNLKNERGCALLHRGAQTCIRSISPSDQGAGTQCCYNSQGNLMVGPPGGGSLDRVHIDTGIPYISHFFHDIIPYWDCCKYATDTEETCADYYKKRPSDNGKQYEAPRPAVGFGDPHLVTLDGVEYTLNGFGEFTVLKVDSPQFTLQGRMKPLVNNGHATRATLFTAFAMRENGSDTVQIQLNGRGLVDVLVNGEIVELEEQGGTIEIQNAWVMKYPNVSKYSAIFRSGISVTVQGYTDLLQMMLLVPQKFKGDTTGLLGLWDDDKTREFLLPNGSFIGTESPATKIHSEFGMKWLTTANESLFTYERGKNHSSHVNVLYRPVFIERGQNVTFSNSALEKRAQDACGDNIQCLYDVSVTGKTSIGMASRQALQELKETVQAIETKACVPIDAFPDGTMKRTDTENGISYKFQCNQAFKLEGNPDISCKDGEWTGHKPKCVNKGPLPVWAVALFGIGCGVLVIAIIVAVYAKCKNSKRANSKANPHPMEVAYNKNSSTDTLDQNAVRAEVAAMSYTNETYITGVKS